MMKQYGFLLSWLLVVLWVSGVSAERFVQFFSEAKLLRLTIDGTVQSSRSDVLGNRIDVHNDFGFDDTTGIAGRMGLVLHRRHEVGIDVRRHEWSQDSIFSTSIRFGGLEFSPNLPVSSSLRLQSIGLFYGYRLLEGDSGFFSLRPGVQIADYKVEIERIGILGIRQETVDDSARVIVPSLEVAGEYYLHSLLALKGEIGGGWGDDRKILILQPMLKVTPYPHVSVLVGYTHIWHENDADDDWLDVTLSGLTFGAHILW
ncbi:hypothetical protein GF339_00885 [candidate division KSB3 bacterium]|uniref:Uncharacterized protein n=1 Tax=candidate division KSB3 bacterium TaxID=2044937 RepID=A0A9D5JSB3_9BACT|nr:hypothetical protein [candidate division KSB3 bacterium]MBD3323104.1 hypothetical protein [candidate division KSB3 bacterium]